MFLHEPFFLSLILRYCITHNLNYTFRRRKNLKMAMHKNPGMRYPHVVMCLHRSSNISARKTLVG